MKVGDRVKFNGYVKRNDKVLDCNDDTSNLTESEQEKIENDESIRLEKLDYITMPNQLEGVIAGKRNIVKSHDFEYTHGHLEIISTEWAPVYLIAVNMSGFFRVPIENITWDEDWFETEVKP